VRDDRGVFELVDVRGDRPERIEDALALARALTGRDGPFGVGRDERPNLLVLGCSRRGPGVDRALHAAGCPVAFAPPGLREHAGEALRRIGVAYLPTEDGRRAAEVALCVAANTGGVLAILEAAERYTGAVGFGVSYLPVEDEAQVRARVRAELDAIVDELAGGPVSVHGELVPGPAVEGLVRRAGALDLLVLGCRGYGPLRRALLGGVSHRVLRGAPCPVMIVPARMRAAAQPPPTLSQESA
jgi:nucleotide-binding universal stress UspA family protein